MQICYRFDAKSRQVILFKQIILRATQEGSDDQDVNGLNMAKSTWPSQHLFVNVLRGRMTVICSMTGKFIQHNSLCVCWSMFELHACMILNLIRLLHSSFILTNRGWELWAKLSEYNIRFRPKVYGQTGAPRFVIDFWVSFPIWVHHQKWDANYHLYWYETIMTPLYNHLLCTTPLQTFLIYTGVCPTWEASWPSSPSTLWRMTWFAGRYTETPSFFLNGNQTQDVLCKSL